MTSLLEKRLVFITGKGGVGKSTVAAALGIVAARNGLRTLICEVSQQERVSQVFLSHGVGYHETEIAPNLSVFSIDPQRALEEYLLLQIRVKPLYDLLFKNRVFTYFAAATPGLRELVTVGKIWELAQLDRRVKKAAKYDLVIVDAPATGHGLGLLRTPKTFGDIARVGPIKRQADAIYGFITDEKRTGVCAVAWPEEMPVNETLDLRNRLRADLDLGLDRVFMNGVYPDLFSDEEAGQISKRYEEELSTNGDRQGAGVVRRAALRAALSEYVRAKSHHEQLGRLEEGLGEVVPLPFLFVPRLDMTALEQLADELEDEVQ